MGASCAVGWLYKMKLGGASVGLVATLRGVLARLALRWWLCNLTIGLGGLGFAILSSCAFCVLLHLGSTDPTLQTTNELPDVVEVVPRAVSKPIALLVCIIRIWQLVDGEPTICPNLTLHAWCQRAVFRYL